MIGEKHELKVEGNVLHCWNSFTMLIHSDEKPFLESGMFFHWDLQIRLNLPTQLIITPRPTEDLMTSSRFHVNCAELCQTKRK